MVLGHGVRGTDGRAAGRPGGLRRGEGLAATTEVTGSIYSTNKRLLALTRRLPLTPLPRTEAAKEVQPAVGGPEFGGPSGL